MDQHWDAYCALSLVHFLAFPECQGGEGPILESIRKIADDDFFAAIEISRINQPSVRRQVAQLTEQTHLQLDFGAHPIILGGKVDLNSPDSGQRVKALETLKPYVDQAAELGSRQFVILSGPDPGEGDRFSATDALVDSIQQLCAYACDCNISVTLETFDRAVEKKALIGPAAEAAVVAERVKRDFPDFGVLYDMAHMVLLNESPVPALSTLKEHLNHVHVGNCVKVP